jgi:hypothetical protein
MGYWEYKTIAEARGDGGGHMLNRLKPALDQAGLDGWEAYGTGHWGTEGDVDGIYILLKRWVRVHEAD